MKRLVFILSLLIGAWMLSPTPEAQAWDSSDKVKKVKKVKEARGGVPELDPSTAGSAMVLLLGGAAWIASRRREEDLV